MSHPPRILNADERSLAGRLLSAGLAERPPSGSLPRALATAAAVATTTAVAGTAAGASLGAGLSAAGVTSQVVLAKWLGIGVLAGALFAAGVELTFQPRPGGGVRTDSVGLLADGPEHAVLRPSGTPGQDSLAGSNDAIVLAPPAAANETPATAPVWSVHGEDSAPGASTLAEEIAMVDVARAAAARRDAAATLAAVARYGERHPGGRFAPEVMALEIEALAAQGQIGAARRLARLFLDRYPSSPLAERVRAVVSSPDFR